MRQHVTLILLAMICVAIAIPAQAAERNGQWLLDGLEADNRVKNTNQVGADLVSASLAMGYVLGIADSYRGQYFDIPPEVTVAQSLAVVKKYLEQNPENWTLPAYLLVIQAMSRAFPILQKK